MRISDWSSDVCSSDLEAIVIFDGDRRRYMKRFRGGARNRQHEIQSLDRAAVDTGKVRPTEHKRLAPLVDLEAEISDPGKPVIPAIAHHRSEERRVGKECVSTCRSRG